MFKFLKEKLKGAVSKFSKEVEEEVVEEVPKSEKKDVKKKKPEQKKEEKQKVAKKKAKPEEKEEDLKAEKDIPEKTEEKQKKKIVPPKKKKVEAEDIEEEFEEDREEIKDEFEGKKKSFFGKLRERISKPREEKEAEEEAEEIEESVEEEVGEKLEEEKKSSFFTKVGEAFTTKTLSQQKFEEIFWDLELVLLENNVAVDVIEKIKNDMKDDLVDKKLKRNALVQTVMESLKKSIDEVLSQDKIDFFRRIEEKKPFVICFFGINGSGKTTSIAKLANLLKKNNVSCVMAAADTFRAAAIDQLQKHGDNIGVKVMKHEYGSDAAAVAYDAIEYAKSKGIDVVLIDTAGRTHSNVNLMDELKKIMRVANPDMKIFVGDSLTGNDMVEQAQKYSETTGIDGIILAKADVDEKGGATISAAYVTKKPILFLGTGQGYDDLEEFDKDKIMKNLGMDSSN